MLAWFWWPMVNKEVDQFIRACKHLQLLNSYSREAQNFLHTIESDTPFDVVFLDFWETGYIQDWDGYRMILKCLDCVIGFGLGAYIGLR